MIRRSFLIALAMTHIALGQQEAVLHNFGAPGDGSKPYQGLAVGPNQRFFGTTDYGGTFDGTVFELVPPKVAGQPWVESVLFDLLNSDGRAGGVLVGRDGNLYVVTAQGGAAECGRVLQLEQPAETGGAWTVNTIYEFFSQADGCFAVGTLAEDSSGDLFGVTAEGEPGLNNSGTVYELTPPAEDGGTWSHTIIHNFHGADGSTPREGLVIGKDGTLYGTTLTGGSSNDGTVYMLQPPASAGSDWVETVIHSFDEGDGANPYAGVVMDESGALYGQTTEGGVNGCACGSVFQLMPPPERGGTWTENVLVRFEQLGGGVGNLAIGPDGVLYGGGESWVYSVTPPASGGVAWTLATVHQFAGPPHDGDGAVTKLIIVGGVIYGTTYGGGDVSPYVGGTIFGLKL